MDKPLKVGLTGGLGAGKSLVLKLLQEKGIPVLQTDYLGHQVLKEKKFSKILTRQFGKGILNHRGIIDRKKLAALVFDSSNKRKKLNELLHPEVRKRVAQWINRTTHRVLPYPMLVVEVPLLFERGYNRAFDRVLCVSAPRVQRQQRLLKRGWDLAEIQRREKAQWSQTRKNSGADWIIFNQSGRKDLKYSVNRWLKKFE
jgi:dephospho-CoA kinase